MTSSKQAVNQHAEKTLALKPSRLRCAIYTRKSTEEGLDQESPEKPPEQDGRKQKKD